MTQFLGGIKFKNKLMFVLIFVLFILSVGFVSASENLTENITGIEGISNDTLDLNYYGEYYSSQLDESSDLDESIVNKTNIANDDADEQSENEDGLSCEIQSDDDYNYSIEVSPIKSNFVKTKYVFTAIKTNDFNTYYKSDIFFKAKIINKLTNAPMSGVKVLFKVYSSKNKYTNYYAVTNKNGVANLNKNLKVGTYTVYTSVKDKNAIFKESKSKLRVKATAEVGCCSFYIQVSSTDAVTGFRRDSTYSADIYIRPAKWYGRTAIRQYKYNGGYCFHSIVTSDGWMIGTGGADSASINNAIEKLSGQMVASGKIVTSSLYKIKSYINQLGIGHYAIKTPDGKYAAVWIDGIKTGKLKNGEYISVPNSAYYFRQGKFTSFDSNPGKAGLKIGATDQYGLNRRQISVFHWKTTTKNFKTSSSVLVCAANDNGYMRGMSTGHLIDNFHYKGILTGKYSLPKTPNMKILGKHKFGNIDKLIKTQTSVNAPKVITKFNKSTYFKVFVKNKKTGKVVKNIKVKIKITYNNTSKTYTFKTNSKGVAKFTTKKFRIGVHRLKITTGDNRYIISKNSKIVIKR